MTLAAERWPAFAGPAAGQKRFGALVAYRLELAKLTRLIQVRTIAAASIIGPFLAVAVLHVQSATPGDTAFGQWVHTSGFAIPMVVLGFGAQWVGPVLTAVVAGDIFSSEDRFGTWKTVLTRSRTRGQLFAGKYLAALTFALGLMLLLTVTDLVAGWLAGAQPVVGLGGQLVPAGHAAELVVLSYLSELPPLLGFTALALMLSTAQIDATAHESAEAYLAAAPLGEPVCLILDNRLPGISGLELLRRIADAGGEAAVIMMTGQGDVPTAVAAMKLGAFHFVEKPFDAEALLNSVEEALSRAEAIQDLQAEALAFRSRRELLTQREEEVFELLIEGLPTKVIASRLDITARTAEHHRAAVMRKLEARSIAHLMRMALGLKKYLTSSATRTR